MTGMEESPSLTTWRRRELGAGAGTCTVGVGAESGTPLFQVRREPLLLEAFGPCLPTSEKGLRFKRWLTQGA